MLTVLTNSLDESEIELLKGAVPRGRVLAASTRDCFALLESAEVDVIVIFAGFSATAEETDLIIRVSNELPNVRIIVIDDTLDISKMAKIKSLGADDFLLKPLERKRLTDSIQQTHGISEEDTKWLDETRDKLKDDIVGESDAILHVIDYVARAIVRSEEPILVMGETGTGKELVCNAVHKLGSRNSKPWTTINISAVPGTLVESHLFGHEKGAFTNASSKKIGLFEEAKDGVLFIDEIGELELPIQVKILRVLQEKKFRRVGGTEQIDFNARLVCATNRNLRACVSDGTFREDLYYRINAHEIHLPPLRARGFDVWVIAEHFLNELKPGFGLEFSRECRQLLKDYSFPGNIRELRNIVVHCISECFGELILPSHLPIEAMSDRQFTQATENNNVSILTIPGELLELDYKVAMSKLEREYCRQYLPRVLAESNGNVSKASETAGMDPKTFRKKWTESELPDLTNRKK